MCIYKRKLIRQRMDRIVIILIIISFRNIMGSKIFEKFLESDPCIIKITP